MISTRWATTVLVLGLVGCGSKDAAPPTGGSGSSTPCSCTHADDGRVVCVPNSVLAEWRRTREGKPPTASLRELDRAFDQCAKPDKP